MDPDGQPSPEYTSAGGHAENGPALRPANANPQPKNSPSHVKAKNTRDNGMMKTHWLYPFLHGGAPHYSHQRYAFFINNKHSSDRIKKKKEGEGFLVASIFPIFHRLAFLLSEKKEPFVSNLPEIARNIKHQNPPLPLLFWGSSDMRPGKNCGRSFLFLRLFMRTGGQKKNPHLRDHHPHPRGGEEKDRVLLAEFFPSH